MEGSIAEAVFLPWWKPLTYLVATVFTTVVAVRVRIKLDLNDLLKRWETNKMIKQQRKIAEKCRHIWTLYPLSPYSRCNRCLVLIATTTLLAMRLTDNPPVIAGTVQNQTIDPPAGALIVDNPGGLRD